MAQVLCAHSPSGATVRRSFGIEKHGTPVITAKGCRCPNVHGSHSPNKGNDAHASVATAASSSKSVNLDLCLDCTRLTCSCKRPGVVADTSPLTHHPHALDPPLGKAAMLSVTTLLPPSSPPKRHVRRCLDWRALANVRGNGRHAFVAIAGAGVGALLCSNVSLAHG